jgi:adhesin/invasin
VAAGAAAPVSPLSWTVKPVTAQIGGVGAPVQFAGLAPGFAGLYQVNVLVPQVPAGTQSVVIAETAAGISSSPPVQIPVR